MHRTAEQLRSDAAQIWRAGVNAVRPERLLPEQVVVDGGNLLLGEEAFDLARYDRIVVVGGGKAGAGMVQGLEAALGQAVLLEKQVGGLVAVPAGCLQPTAAIRLVAGRPDGVNEPRPEGAAAAAEMLRLVGSLGPRDLCLCLLSGGASALLPAPIEGVSLEQKIALTRLLSAGGATINQLNAVRSALSQIKGGGLARACQAGTLATLIVSDVLGDPLDVIGSGPTVPCTTGPGDALAVLQSLGLLDTPDTRPVVARLQERIKAGQSGPAETPPATTVILANNAAAVDAAGIEAERLGYNHAMDCATASEGPAEAVGCRLAEMALRMRDQPGPNCLITGGEPTVKLADAAVRGVGGRNQQLVLAAMQQLGHSRGVALLSGGTDGEDGPTDAAGALVDEQIVSESKKQRLNAADALRRNDAYPFFDACGGLVKTGPTHTNVCDLRVVTVSQPA